MVPIKPAKVIYITACPASLLVFLSGIVAIKSDFPEYEVLPVPPMAASSQA
jgi:hypothetical protein